MKKSLNLLIRQIRNTRAFFALCVIFYLKLLMMICYRKNMIVVMIAILGMSKREKMSGYQVGGLTKA
jgi:hypothetical protein